MHPILTRALIACAGIVAALAIVTAATGAGSQDSRTRFPQIPSATSVYGACWNVQTGALRLIPVRLGCDRTTERRASWHKLGQRGPRGERGAVGAKGARGRTGAVGQSGAQGPAGAKGDPGPGGALGPAGATGPAGPAGSDGPPGSAGPAGPAGSNGPVGPAGPIGPAGSEGPAGPVGPAGSDGPAGPAGSVGPVGPIGPSGPTASSIVNDGGVTRSGVAGNTAGVIVADTASCAAGKVLLGGGAAITSGGGTYAQSQERVDLLQSYPSAAATWTATVGIRQNFVAASNVTITAYAICTV